MHELLNQNLLQYETISGEQLITRLRIMGYQDTNEKEKGYLFKGYASKIGKFLSEYSFNMMMESDLKRTYRIICNDTYKEKGNTLTKRELIFKSGLWDGSFFKGIFDKECKQIHSSIIPHLKGIDRGDSFESVIKKLNIEFDETKNSFKMNLGEAEVYIKRNLSIFITSRRYDYKCYFSHVGGGVFKITRIAIAIRFV